MTAAHNQSQQINPALRQLLPCPFCGGKAEVERPGTAKQSCIIACDNCGCRLETGEVWSMGERWNTRAPASGDVRAAVIEECARVAELEAARWPETQRSSAIVAACNIRALSQSPATDAAAGAGSCTCAALGKNNIPHARNCPARSVA